MDNKRLFVALCPPAVIQRNLAVLAGNDPHGIPVVARNLHLTLVFLGSTGATQEACYRRALVKLRFEPVTLEIDRFGFWREPRVLWAAPKEVPAELFGLVEDIHALLQPCGFVPESRPFRAHITLKRKYPGPAPDWGIRSPIRWLADTVALVWSQNTPQGVCYRPLLQIPAIVPHA